MQVGQAVSTQRSLSAGVPQGSVLGPLLAILYLNRLSDTTENEMLFFADDSSLYASHNSTKVQAVQHLLQRDLDSISRYGEDWIITFNATKTTQQTFTKKSQPPSLVFDGITIPTSDSHKHLGLTISSDLRFKSHVNNALLKFNRTLSPLFPIACMIPRQILLNIYQMYVQPHLDYCDSVFDCHLTVFDKSRLEKAQNRAARLITAMPRRTPTAGLRAELGWTTLHDRRRTHRLQLYHKIIYDERVPTYIKDIIPKTRNSATTRDLRSTQSHTLTIPVTRTTSYARSLVPATTRIWNKLPEYIREESSPKQFKTSLHVHMNIKPPDRFFSIGSKKGNMLHTRIRLKVSNLHADQNKLGTINSAKCKCGAPKETTEHFLLICSLFHTERMRLYDHLATILGTNFRNTPQKNKIDILINGPSQSALDTNTNVALAVQHFIFQTRRFASDNQ